MTPLSLLAGRAVVTVIVTNTRFVYKTIYLGLIVMFLLKECTTTTILRRLFFIFLFIFFCVRIKTRILAKIMSYNVPGMIWASLIYCLQLRFRLRLCECIFSSEPSLLAKEHYDKASPEIRPAASLDTCSYCEHTGFTLHVKASCVKKS